MARRHCGNPGSWSVAECLDHLAISNRIYLKPMTAAAAHARAKGRVRRGPALPGWSGRWFSKSMEPPVKALRAKAPGKMRPRSSPGLADALGSFLASQGEVRAFLQAQWDLDLAGVSFANPVVPGIRFSLAAGLQIIATHERRHLWQAWQVRQCAESTR